VSNPAPAASAPVESPSESIRRPALAPRWSWRLATIAGIDLHVHGSFLLLMAFIALRDLVSGRGATAALRGSLLIIAIFATIVLHELGHALTARRFGVRTRNILLLPIGGIARMESLPAKPSQQLVVALAGPAVSAYVALLLYGIARLFDWPVGLGAAESGTMPFITQLMWVNVSLAVFNVLPGYPLDGGRILRALLAMRLPPERATQIAARVGQGVAVLLAILGLYFNPLLVVIAVFVWLGAQAEHSMSTAKVALSGLSVRHGMITDFQYVSPADPLSKAVDLTLSGFQQDFPVMEGRRLVGVLSHADLLKGLAEKGRNMSVREAMQTQPATVSSSEGLEGALKRMRQRGCRVLMVIDDEDLVGLLSAGNVGELLAIEAAGRSPHPAGVIAS
jgi:Zn-dependent protease